MTIKKPQLIDSFSTYCLTLYRQRLRYRLKGLDAALISLQVQKPGIDPAGTDAVGRIPLPAAISNQAERTGSERGRLVTR